MNRALGEAIRMSQAQARSNPAPTTVPLIMAITGFSMRCRPRIIRWASRKLRRMSSTFSDTIIPGLLPP